MDLPEPEFKALISEYLLILGSKYIDDESLYLKHLQKQAQLQNTHALRQLSVLQQFDAIIKDIQSQITEETSNPFCALQTPLIHVCLIFVPELGKVQVAAAIRRMQVSQIDQFCV